MSFTITMSMLLLTTVLSLFLGPSFASSPHLINFWSPNLYPEFVTWDSTAQHLIVSSLRHPTLLSVSDAGVNALVSDDSIPINSSFLGITIDTVYNRVLPMVHPHSQPSECALATYYLRSTHRRLFLAILHDATSTTFASDANEVTIDFSGNAFVTNSASNFILKVDIEGNALYFLNPKLPQKHLKYPNSCGLNGIAYCSKGYLIVAQSNTGNLYKVDSEDGTTRKIQLNNKLNSPDRIAIMNFPKY